MALNIEMVSFDEMSPQTVGMVGFHNSSESVNENICLNSLIIAECIAMGNNTTLFEKRRDVTLCHVWMLSTAVQDLSQR